MYGSICAILGSPIDSPVRQAVRSNLCLTAFLWGVRDPIMRADLSTLGGVVGQRRGGRHHLLEMYLQILIMCRRLARQPPRLGRWIHEPDPSDVMSDANPIWTWPEGRRLWHGELLDIIGAEAADGAKGPVWAIVQAGVVVLPHVCSPMSRRYLDWDEAREAWPDLLLEARAKTAWETMIMQLRRAGVRATLGSRDDSARKLHAALPTRARALTAALDGSLTDRMPPGWRET